jgi:hypothetical protein
MAIGFKSLLQLARVLDNPFASASPLYVNDRNADLMVNRRGALWTAILPGGGPNFSGTSFSSGAMVATHQIAAGGIILRSLAAFSDTAAPGAYLQLFSQAAVPVAGNIPLYCFTCPDSGMAPLSFPAPYGLLLSAGSWVAFSSTPGTYTAGPTGWVQGIHLT